jgi:hypothetical protein
MIEKFAELRFTSSKRKAAYLSSGLRPVNSSNITTPKLYTSLFTVYVPDIANSGALYPKEPTISDETCHDKIVIPSLVQVENIDMEIIKADCSAATHLPLWIW